MKKILTFLITLILGTNLIFAQSVGINSDGSAPASSAMLDVSSTAKGFLAPRMTAAQKAAITSPATGLLVYQTDASAGYYYNSGTPASPLWVQLGAASGSSQWTTTGSNIYYNTGNVGIGTTTPASKLHIAGADMNNALLFENTSANAGRNFILFKTQGTEQGYIGLGGGATNHMSVAAYGESNNLFLETNGTVKMTVLPSGNVGIGTTTPYTTLTVGSTDATARITAGGPNTHLTLASAGPNGDIYLNAGGVESGNYSTSTRLSVGSNGNVGIGTTTPGSPLHIKGVGEFYTLRLESTTTVGPGIRFQGSGTYDGKTWTINAGGSGNPFGANKFVIYDETAGQVRMTINTDGNVGIGTTAPDVKLKVVTNVADYTAVLSNTLNSTGSMGLFISNGSNSTGGATMVGFYRPDGIMLGSIGQSGATSVAYNTTSDYRLKDNIVNTHFGINDLMKIQVRDYVYKADASKTQVTGFIAQELYEIFPNAVTKPSKPEDMWSVDYGKVTPLLVKAVQDQEATIKAQQKQIDELKAQNITLSFQMKAEIETLKKAVYGSTVVQK